VVDRVADGVADAAAGFGASDGLDVGLVAEVVGEVAPPADGMPFAQPVGPSASTPTTARTRTDELRRIVTTPSCRCRATAATEPAARAGGAFGVAFLPMCR
jgi:hypothetical protein